MDRAKKKNSPSNEEEILLETKHVTQALFANNYPTHFLRKGHQLNTERETSANDANQGGLVILPYAKGFSEKIARVLKSFSIKVEHKRIRIISNILKKPIERTSEEAVRGVSYRVKCKECPSVYIAWSDLARAKNMHQRTCY